MKETGAILAGELSGHICVKHNGDGFDDAFFAALLTLEIMANNNIPCSHLFAGIPEMVFTPEVKVAIDEERKFQVMDALIADFRADDMGGQLIDLDGVRLSFPDGWMLIRASNTTANLTVRVEGTDRDYLLRIGKIVASALEKQKIDTDQLQRELTNL